MIFFLQTTKKGGSLLSNIDAERWIGAIVRVRSGERDGTEAEVLGSGNGWVQLQMRGKATLAKRAHELEVVEVDGVAYPPLPRRSSSRDSGSSSSSSGSGSSSSSKSSSSAASVKSGKSGSTSIHIGASVMILTGVHKNRIGRVESSGFGQYTIRVGSNAPVRLRGDSIKLVSFFFIVYYDCILHKFNDVYRYRFIYLFQYIIRLNTSQN